MAAICWLSPAFISFQLYDGHSSGDPLKQAKEEVRLATCQLPSTFAREILIFARSTPTSLAVGPFSARDKLGLRDEQVHPEALWPRLHQPSSQSLRRAMIEVSCV